MTVTDLAAHRQPTVRWNGTATALVVAAGLINTNSLTDCDITVLDDGHVLILDWTRQRHAVGEVRLAAQALGISLKELAADAPDGTAAIELRGSVYQDGILRIIRAVVPVPADWNVL